MNKKANNQKNKAFAYLMTAALCCLSLFGTVCQAKSLYVAGYTGNINEAKLWVYDVQPNGELVLQTTKTFPQRGYGNVNGLGVDPNTNTVFVTYSDTQYGGMLDSETLDWKKFVYLVPVDTWPGGMVYDEAYSRIYTTDEGKNRLIVYRWVPEYLGWYDIIQQNSGVSEVLLSRSNNGAIALDPEYEIVYVASKNGGVEYLQTNEILSQWQQKGYILSGMIVDALSVDSSKQYLYAGGMTQEGATITRYDLRFNTQKDLVLFNTSERVLSICADNATSLVYVLLENLETEARTIKVYNSDLNAIQTLTVNGKALELFVPSSSVGFNPLELSIAPISGVSQSNNTYIAGPGSEVTYQISMTNSNLYPVTDIALTNTLAPELEFVRTEGLGNALGVFDSQSHTYYYHNPLVDPNATASFNLVARVNEQATSGVVMTSSVTVDSNETAQSSVSVDVEVGYNTLSLTKTVVMDPNYTKIGDTIYVQAGDYITYQICVSNLNNYSAVTNVLLVDQLSDYVDFVSAEQGGLINHYDASTHSYSWAFNTFEPNYIDCFDITVRVKDTIQPGQVITNEVLVGGSETYTVTAHANVTVKYDALSVNLGIADTPDYNPVTNQIMQGGILTYVIDVNNTDPNNAAESVMLMDNVPEGLLYIGSTVSGDANGVYDSISRTFVLEQPVIAPGQGIHAELTFVVADNVPGNTVLTNTLVAMANGAMTANKSVSVSVYQPATGSVTTTLDLYYTTPLRTFDNDNIMVVMKFPDYINLSDIDKTQPLVMTPGSSVAQHQGTVEGVNTIYYVYGADGKVRVKGFFNSNPILDSLQPGQESVTISVTGSLKDGRSFVGQTTVSVN